MVWQESNSIQRTNDGSVIITMNPEEIQKGNPPTVGENDPSFTPEEKGFLEQLAEEAADTAQEVFNHMLESLRESGTPTSIINQLESVNTLVKFWSMSNNVLQEMLLSPSIEGQVEVFANFLAESAFIAVGAGYGAYQGGMVGLAFPPLEPGAIIAGGVAGGWVGAEAYTIPGADGLSPEDKVNNFVDGLFDWLRGDIPASPGVLIESATPVSIEQLLGELQNLINSNQIDGGLFGPGSQIGITDPTGTSTYTGLNLADGTWGGFTPEELASLDPANGYLPDREFPLGNGGTVLFLQPGDPLLATPDSAFSGLGHDGAFDPFTQDFSSINFVRRDPLVLDKDDDGIEFVNLKDSAVLFDLDGDGRVLKTGWTDADEAFLAVDANHNGRIDDITELFGSATRSGFAELAANDNTLYFRRRA